MKRKLGEVAAPVRVFDKLVLERPLAHHAIACAAKKFQIESVVARADELECWERHETTRIDNAIEVVVSNGAVVTAEYKTMTVSFSVRGDGGWHQDTYWLTLSRTMPDRTEVTYDCRDYAADRPAAVLIYPDALAEDVETEFTFALDAIKDIIKVLIMSAIQSSEDTTQLAVADFISYTL